jgi:hypothetical protein
VYYTSCRRLGRESRPEIGEATDLTQYIISRGWRQGGVAKKTEVGSGKSEVGKINSRGQRTEVRGRKAEDRSQRTCIRCQVSAQPPAKKTAGLIEKETLKKRISNIEY